jgi:hypothetical protein
VNWDNERRKEEDCTEKDDEAEGDGHICFTSKDLQSWQETQNPPRFNASVPLSWGAKDLALL